MRYECETEIDTRDIERDFDNYCAKQVGRQLTDDEREELRQICLARREELERMDHELRLFEFFDRCLQEIRSRQPLVKVRIEIKITGLPDDVTSFLISYIKDDYEETGSAIEKLLRDKGFPDIPINFEVV